MNRRMLVLLGETRSRYNLAILRGRAWGRIFLYRRPTPYPGEPWGFDNGAFGAYAHKQDFPTDEFLRRIEVAQKSPRPILAVLPDIVAAGERSLEFSLSWRERLSDINWPWYLAVQDQMTIEQVSPYCSGLAGLFLGGSDEFKSTAESWSALARKHRIKFHYGRASTPRKLTLAYQSGADSCDSAFPLWRKDRMKTFCNTYDSLRPNHTTPLGLS